MKILLVHRFFWPDSPPYAVILNEMAELLTEQGHEVDVLSSIPSYKSVDSNKQMPFKSHAKAGYKIYRLPVFNQSKAKFFKFLNFVLFPILVFFFLLSKRRYNVVTVSSAPPVILAFFVSLAVKIKGSSLIYHCMDLHPEIGRLSGEFRNSLVYKLFRSMELFSCRTAKHIIVLSTDMKNSMIERSESLLNKTSIINNFSLPSYENKQCSHEIFKKDAQGKRLIFAGNIGRFQGLDILLEAMKSFDKPDQIELVFLGEGAYLSTLKKAAEGLTNIKFIPHQSVDVAKQLIRDADFGIVSLQDDVIRYAYPSKTMAYLECGIPILLCTNKDSELADLIESNRVGYFASTSDVSSLHQAFNRIVDSNDKILNGDKISDFYQQNFSKRIFDEKFLQLIEQ